MLLRAWVEQIRVVEIGIHQLPQFVIARGHLLLNSEQIIQTAMVRMQVAIAMAKKIIIHLDLIMRTDR